MSLLIHFLGFFTASIPVCLAAAIARLLGRIVFATMPSRRRLVLRNLHHCFPEKTEDERRAIALESTCRMVEMGMFVLAAPYFSEKKIRSRFTMDAKAIDAVLDAQTPVVAGVPHFSLMEVLTMIPLFSESVKKRDCGVFYRPFDNSSIERWVKSTRERFGFKLLSRKKGLTQALSFLDKNGIVCVLFDQSPGKKRGVLSLFEDRVVTNSMLAGTLAAGKAGTQLITVYCERSGFWRGTIRIEKPEVSELSAVGYTVALNRWLEGKLAENFNLCSDWLWMHDRWKGFNGLNLEHRKSILEETVRLYGYDALPRKKRIWIRLPNWLGDIVMAFPLIQTIRAARPDAQITLLARKHFLPMLELLGVADRLIALPPKGKGYWKFCRNLRTEYPDQHLLFTNSLRGDVEAKLIGAPQRFGMVRKGYPRPYLTKKWRVPADLDLTKNHQTHVWAQWLRESCGLKHELDFSPIKIESEKQLRIGMICGTENSPEKRWPIERWRELIALLQKKYPNLQIYLFGTAKDGAITAQVAEGQNENVVDRAGKTDLPAYMRELASCCAICGNDTGGMHLANMLGVPVVGIFGPTNPVRTGPIFNAPACILQPENCPPTGGADIRGVSAQNACNALEKFI